MAPRRWEIVVMDARQQTIALAGAGAVVCRSSPRSPTLRIRGCTYCPGAPGGTPSAKCPLIQSRSPCNQNGIPGKGVLPMDRDSLAVGLSTLIGGLQPAPGVSAGDLHEVRLLATYEILRGRGAALTTIPPFGDSSTINAAAPADAAETAALLSVANSAIAELSRNPNAFEDIRVFRRT